MTGIDSTPLSALTATDLTTKLYRFGKHTSAGINVCTVLGERADCVLGCHYKATPVAGDAIDIYIERKFPIEAGEAFLQGAKLTTDANGRAVAAGDGHHVVAIAAEAATASGDVVTARPPLGSVPASGVDAIVAVSAPGAIPPTASYVLLTVDGTDPFTIAAGEEGHEITIDCIVATSTPRGTLTLADAYGSESLTHVFHEAGQRMTFRMTSTGWKLVDKKRAGALTVVVGTDVLTGYDLAATYNLSVTGTVSSTTTKAIPAGMIEGEEIDVQVTTAATSPDGEIGITAIDADGSAFTLIDAIDGTTSHNAHFRWNGAAWRNTSLTGLTLA